MTKIKGAMSALITPFKHGKLDLECYEMLIKRQLSLGMNAVVPVGTTGESATLDEDEQKECIQIAVNACKNTNAFVLAGAGSNDTAKAIRLAQNAAKAGADAILCVVPYYNKPSQEGLYQHFASIARALKDESDMAIVLYNVPSRTQRKLEESTIKRLFDDYSNITALKDATGDIKGVSSLLARIKGLDILSGDDALNLAILASGGSGMISVTGNLLPNEISKLYALCKAGDYAAAREQSQKLVAINEILFCEANPLPIKAAMHIAGLCELEYRLPLCAPSKQNMSKIEQIMKNYNIKG